MKKNVLRILLAFVMAALVFALVACNGNTDSGTSKKDGKNTDKSTDKTGEEEVDAVEQLRASLTSVVSGVDPYIEMIKSIEATSEVGLDIAIGGYYDNTGSKKSAGNFKLGLSGNARPENPELKVAFSLDDSKSGAGTDYLAIGYQDGKLYLTEPLSLINQGKNAKPNSIEMDASMLVDGVNNVAAFGMKKLAGVTGGINFSLSTMVGGLLEGDIVGMAAGLIESDLKSDNKEIALIVASKNVKSIVGLLEDSIPTATINTALNFAYENFGLYVNGTTIGLDKEEAADGTALTFAKVVDEFAPSLKIIAAFDKENTANDKSLNAVKVELNFESLNLAVGLSVDLTMLEVGKEASINFEGYDPQNLTSSVKVGLGQKDKYATLTATANTATAFASEETNVATASLTLGDATNKALGTALAKYDGQTIYLDFSGFTTAIANAAEYTVPTADKFAYTFTYGENAADFGKEEGNPFNVKTALAYMLENVGKTEKEETTTEKKVEKAKVAEGAALETKGIWTTVYNLILSIKEGYFGAYDYIGSDAKSKKYPLYVWDEAKAAYVILVNEDGEKVYLSYKAEATQEDVTELLASVEWISKFVNVDLTDSKGKGLSLETIGNSLSEKFNAVKEIFTGDNAAAQASGEKASVKLFSTDGKDLVSVVTMFVNIPVVGEDGKFQKDENGKFVVAKDVKIDTAEKAQSYIAAIFALDDEDAATSYATWDAEVKEVFGITETEGFKTSIIETVLGIDLEQFCAGGVVLYARYDKDAGLSGAIGVENTEGDNYIEIGASIGFVDADDDLASDVTTTADAASIASEDAEGKWSMNDQIWKTIVAALKYVF